MQSACNLKPKKEAAAFSGQAAGRNRLQGRNYQAPTELSTKKIPKILIGQALLFGDKRNPAFWPAFEALLRRAI